MTNPTYRENRTGVPQPRTKKHKIYCQKEAKRNANPKRNKNAIVYEHVDAPLRIIQQK